MKLVHVKLSLASSLAAGAVAASAQVRYLPPLEFPGDPYMPPSLVYSPRIQTVVQHGPYISTQVNVDSQGNNIVGDAANEPSICVNPIDRKHMAIGFRQFDNVASNFRQGGYAYTADNGRTWTFPGVLEPGVFRSDPVLGSDRNGKFYYLSLMGTFYDDIWESTDFGRTWTLKAFATGGDKQWMTIDTTNSIGLGNIYQYWSTAGNNYGGRQFSRSTDGGGTWLNPIFIPQSPVWGTLDTNRDGDLYLVGVSGSIFKVVRSNNAKDSGAAPTFQTPVNVSLGGYQMSGGAVNPAGLIGQAWIAIDKSLGLPTSGNIYVLASVRRNSTNPADVMFARSTNGGASFSAPVRVNSDPTGQTRYHWFGAMSVAPNGRIDVVWNDTRADATNTWSALYYSYSTNGGARWSKNVQVSPPFNHFLGYPNQNKMGDYIGIVSDNAGASVAYTATFNGEQDVYYVRIPVVGRT